MSADQNSLDLKEMQLNLNDNQDQRIKESISDDIQHRSPFLKTEVRLGIDRLRNGGEYVLL